MTKYRYGAAALAMVIVGCMAGNAPAQPVEQFYKGRQVNLLMGFNPGGGFDTYGRLISQHMPEHLPGKPSFVVKYMPGAGSMIAANHLYNRSPKDGTEIGLISSDMSIAPLMKLPSVNFDSRKLTWLGSADSDAIYCFAWNGTPFNSFKDVLNREMVIGTAGIQMSNVANILVQVVEAKFKVVKGYKGTAAVRLATQRGEIQGWCGVGITSVTTPHPDWIPNGTIKVIGQIGYEKQTEFANVPDIADFAKNDEDRRLLKFIFSYPYLARPFVAPPAIPDDRARALRGAFAAAMRDQKLIEQAKKSNVTLKLVTGEQIHKFIEDAFDTPPAVVERAAKTFLQGKKKKKKK
jgi:tripartite-type tricarboxylate transporter receptor subunit TctC